MMYRVIAPFTDLEDNNHAYKINDTYPRSGVEISSERVRLLSGENKYNTQFIVEEINRLAISDLMELTTKEIKALAAERGYTIEKGNRNEVISQFLQQQNG